MTEAEASRIERELGITLPSDYRELMRHYDIPWRITLSEDALPEITDVELFIKQEKELREHGLMHIADYKWPQHYLSIGTNGFGDMYFLNLSRGGSAVFEMSHETGEVSEVAPSLRQFIDDQLREEAEAEDELDRRTGELAKYCPDMVHEIRPNKNRKWWQFWKPRYIRRRYPPPIR